MKKQLEDIRILVVDDEPMLLEAISHTLTRHGAIVFTAQNGLEAMESISQNPVDFILSDMRMPKSDGIEFLKVLRGTYPQPPPFFFLTGYAAEYSMETLKQLGANDVVSKPFSANHLIELIKVHLKK